MHNKGTDEVILHGCDYREMEGRDQALQSVVVIPWSERGLQRVLRETQAGFFEILTYKNLYLSKINDEYLSPALDGGEITIF